MKQSFTRTLFKSDLTKATFKLIFTENVKWETDDLEDKPMVEYKGVTRWDIISGEDAKDIEMVDEAGEFLVLHFVDGRTATFRNSHTIMFVF